MALPRRASGGVFDFTAVSPTGLGAFKLRSIGDNRSTLPNAIAARATLVEPLSPMALLRSIGDNRSTLPNAPAARATLVEPLSPMALPRRASGGVFGSTAVFSHRLGCLLAPIDWGQSIYTKAIIFYVPKSGHKPHLLLHSIRRRKATVGRI